MRRRPMQFLARWHIRIAWIAAVPVLVWLASGLFMALRPIEEVRGNTLKREAAQQPFTLALAGAAAPIPLREGKLLTQRGRAILLATGPDGRKTRIDLAAGNRRLPPVDEAEARQAVAGAIIGGEAIVAARPFAADRPPLDWRRPEAVWQVTLRDGTHVYVGRDSGEIEAVRTRWWRVYDFLWGLHIMDPVGRERANNRFVWAFSAIALVVSLFGTILLFRRRRVAR